ncbi:hypothetical protein NUW58_g5331 [Xylaria curta]|uniref:Uncharacterized protein n=1 Tax=Xylaria curta TaxID=42375 RepID=A0ACC1P3C3_9PEZI|nr:hypothetical protein NUW58_g5331 [Xylaria curta]
MERLGIDEDLPNSPWANRFRVNYNTFVSQDENHSLLVPFPRIDDPKYYDQEPGPVGNLLPLSNANKDKLFSSEVLQNEEFHGKKTWQVATLNRWVWFSPETGFLSGGHQLADKKVADIPVSNIPAPAQTSLQSVSLQTRAPTVGTNEERDFLVYQRERIKVDESRWLPFLRRQRWFDWIQAQMPYKVKSGRTWSVDDPDVWENMGVVLELTNRIFEALINDKHEGDYWNNLKDIFGKADRDDDTVILTHSTERWISQKRNEKRCSWDFILRQTPDQWRARLNLLLRKFVFTFGDTKDAFAINTREAVAGDSSMPFPSVTVIGIKGLQAILESKLALSEVCVLQFDIAVKIIHETMHAILMARFKDDNYMGNLWTVARSGKYPDEPFVNGVGINEIGHCMDQWIWGGVFYTEPTRDTGHGAAAAPPLGYSTIGFPWAGYTNRPAAPGSTFTQIGAPIWCQSISAAWVSKILGEAFWKDKAYPRKSDNFFHRNVLLASMSSNAGRRPREWVEPKLQNVGTQAHNYAEDAKLLAEWQNKSTTSWTGIRIGWFAPAFKEWKMSPWSDDGRVWVQKFADAFAAKDTIVCAEMANKMVNKLDWDQNLASFKGGLPMIPRRLSCCLWAWHAVGLLMQASIPARAVGNGRISQRSKWFSEHQPSREASAAGYGLAIFIPAGEKPFPPLEIPPSKFIDINGQQQYLPQFSQLSYLKRLDDLFEILMKESRAVHCQLFSAICSARNALIADRVTIANNYPGYGHTTRWASDWFFKVPEYDPEYIAFFPADDTWRSVPSHVLDLNIPNP